MSAGLVELLSKINVGLRRGIYTNETTVREAVIMPVLRSLGWDDLDPGIVRREYHLRGTRVDYALFTQHDTPDLLIEFKAVGLLAGGEKQLFEYAFHDGVPMALLTSGQEWSFYLPAGQGSYEERRFFKLDLLEHEERFSANALQRYLDFERVYKKTAIYDARLDHEAASKTRKATQTLKSAWNDLLAEPDDLLVDLLIEKTETLCGYAPSKEDAEAFVTQLATQSEQGTKQLSQARTSENLIPEAAPSSVNYHAKPASVMADRVSITLNGMQHFPKDASTGLKEILLYLEANDATFFQRLAVRALGRSRITSQLRLKPFILPSPSF